MRIGRRAIAGLLAVPLLLPVPALAIQQSLVHASGRVTAKAGGNANTIILHQNDERKEFIAFSRALRAQYSRSGNALKASTNRYLQDLLKELRAHWRTETRTGVSSSFNFPDL